MSVTLSQPLLLLLLGAWSGCVVEGDEEATTAHTLLLGQPQDLQVLESNITSTSIRLSWTMDTILPIEPIEGYRVFYMKNKYIDAKTFMGSKPEYTLTGLDPYTIYTVWVKAFGKDSESPESEKITVTTDTNVPSAPRLTNVTCYDTLKVYVEWRRPEVFHLNVDYYYVYYKPKSDSVYQRHQIQGNTEDPQRFFLEDNENSKLETRQTYEVKICAGTKSIYRGQVVYMGEFSEEQLVYLPLIGCSQDDQGPGEMSAGMILGAVASVLFLILAIIGFVVWRRYFKAAYYYLEDPPRLVPPVGIPDWEEEPSADGGRGPVSVEDFPAHVSRLHVDSDIGFSREYDEILKYSAKSVHATHEHSSLPDNKHKNRYLNIVAYDHSRVQLSQLPGQKKGSDYINANYIDGFQKFHAYIGTQGPLDETFESFWRMVWEQNVYVIVMITNLTERGRRKCDMYWPKEGTATYGNLEVQLVKEEVMSNYSIRTMKTKHLKLKKKKWYCGERTVLQYHYTSWPDHGTPADTLPVLSFVAKSTQSNPPDGGPIIVHCSAGVGRTGTYIVIDAMLRQAKAKQELNVFGFLKHIRSQRSHLVQTEEQYVFLHDALAEALLSGITTTTPTTIATDLIALHEPVSEVDSTTRLQRQYDLVTAFSPNEYDHMAAKKPFNLAKNRDPSLLPVESARVCLTPKPGTEGSDYINATWLQGYTRLREFVVTQHPTQDTRDAFWTMLWDHNSQTVVLLTTIDEDTTPVFWPQQGEVFDMDCFKVRFIEETNHEGHSTLDFVVSSKVDDYELTVRVIHCSGWPYNARPLHNVLNVVNLVQSWYLEYQNGPLVVVDKFGGTEAATFCALTTLSKQLNSENQLDIYQVAKLYHNKRPCVWRSKEDYLYLYRVFDSLHRKEGDSVVECGDENGGTVPERRHSSTEWRGAVVKIPLTRRHSHPSGSLENGATASRSNGCVVDIVDNNVETVPDPDSEKAGSTVVLVTDDLICIPGDEEVI